MSGEETVSSFHVISQRVLGMMSQTLHLDSPNLKKNIKTVGENSHRLYSENVGGIQYTAYESGLIACIIDYNVTELSSILLFRWPADRIDEQLIVIMHAAVTANRTVDVDCLDLFDPRTL